MERSISDIPPCTHVVYLTLHPVLTYRDHTFLTLTSFLSLPGVCRDLAHSHDDAPSYTPDPHPAVTTSLSPIHSFPAVTFPKTIRPQARILKRFGTSLCLSEKLLVEIAGLFVDCLEILLIVSHDLCTLNWN